MVIMQMNCTYSDLVFIPNHSWTNPLDYTTEFILASTSRTALVLIEVLKSSCVAVYSIITSINTRHDAIVDGCQRSYGEFGSLARGAWWGVYSLHYLQGGVVTWR